MANRLHCAYAFDCIVDQLNSTTSPPTNATTMPTPKQKFPLFVTWKKKHHTGEWRLRGCIGTFSAKELHSGIKEYAKMSAFQDTRFSPIKSIEVPLLRCDVSLLTNFEPAASVTDWEVGKHGITIDFTDPLTHREYGATYLPEVASEQGWDVETTLTELIHKSGYRGNINSSLMSRIKVTRYQSSKSSCTYQQYQQLKNGSPVAPDESEEECED
jgi:uncharacterized protein (TIGR00296 family)